ncbi:hypothetical protein SSP24_64140 [Streptomyces spinoverrucosus]|uniref:Uncharacterized protein n=1 Tax=Streptomyces spinoverrucosus TaxID=284043 RepID=A0A4Y3VSW7_9ACTN|nr:hypothetical protein SSP24_64140 [Streptomyces spinoverrucosus]GHB64010.1 hypothetical protein GCM10010397_37670 [Streptomyces spinoverrucosus]
MGGLYVTMGPALGVEFGQGLDTAQCDAGVRFDGRVLPTAGLPQVVKARPFVPRLEVPRPALPLAVREVIEAEAMQYGTLARGGERGPGLGGPVGRSLDRVAEFHSVVAPMAFDLPDHGAPAVHGQALGRGHERVEHRDRQFRG